METVQQRAAAAQDDHIDVAKYVSEAFTPYYGDSHFLAGPTERTKLLWSKLEDLCAVELEKGILGVDPHVPSTVTAFGPGYIDREHEVIVGMQTDAPLKRAIKPLGGINMVKAALQVCIMDGTTSSLLLAQVPFSSSVSSPPKAAACSNSVQKLGLWLWLFACQWQQLIWVSFASNLWDSTASDTKRLFRACNHPACYSC